MQHPLILLALTTLTTALPLLKHRAPDDGLGYSIHLGPLRGEVPDLKPVVNFPIAVWEAGENSLERVGEELPVDLAGILGAR